MPDVHLQRLVLPDGAFWELAAEAAAEGYNFLEPIEAEWDAGVERFHANGHALLGAYQDARLVAVGAITREANVADLRAGRLRRMFVRQAWRNQGIGRVLVLALLRHARPHFDRIYLQAENEVAARLYARFGFSEVQEAFASHCLRGEPWQALEAQPFR